VQALANVTWMKYYEFFQSNGWSESIGMPSHRRRSRSRGIVAPVYFIRDSPYRTNKAVYRSLHRRWLGMSVDNMMRETARGIPVMAHAYGAPLNCSDPHDKGIGSRLQGCSLRGGGGGTGAERSPRPLPFCLE
jgi:hypothetical protein